MFRLFVQLDEIVPFVVNPLFHFVRRVPRVDVRKEFLALADEPSIGLSLRHRAIRGGVVCDADFEIVHSARELALTRGRHFHLPATQQRAQVNQDAVWNQYAPNFTQGMDHALMRDTSKRPCEYGNVERLF